VSGRLERELLASGDHVVRVAPGLTETSRRAARQPGKSDPIDATAIARAALREGIESLPCERSAPITPGSSSGLRSKLYTPSIGLRRDTLGSALPPPPQETVALTARQASLDATDRSLAPPKGLSTLGFDPTRFQTEPPACYRASWQLPGPDSHRQATTSCD